MNQGQVRYGNSYNPYPYGNPSNNASTASVSSLASTSSKILSLFKKDKPPPVPEKDYPYSNGRNALPSSSSLSLSMTLSDAGTTASGHSGSTSGTGKRTANIFKIGKRSKKNKEKDPYYGHAPAESISSPQNVKHELHVDGGLTGFPPEWEASLLQLGYTREELDRMVMDRQRRNLSAANNLIPLGGDLTQPMYAGPSTSTAVATAPIRYPSPPQQFPSPVNPQLYQQAQVIAPVHQPAPALQNLKLKTDISSGHGSASNSPAQFAPSLRSIPDRVASPASSIRSNQQSQAGSDPRSSPVPSLSRERDQYFPPSHLSKEVPIPAAPRVTEASIVPPVRQAPTRPAPPPFLFSDRANTYKPPKAIAIQGDDSDDDDVHLRRTAKSPSPPPPPSKASLEQSIPAPSREALRPISGENNVTPTKASVAVDTNRMPSSPLPTSDSVPSATTPNTATPLSMEKAPRISLNSVPRISLSLGLGDLNKGLNIGADAGKHESIAWSDAIFSALPSATAFGGFRSSISPKTLSGKSTPISARSPAGDRATDDRRSPSPLSANASPAPTTTPGLLPTPSPLSSRPSPGPPKLELTSGFSPLSGPFSSTSSTSLTQRLSPGMSSALPSAQPSVVTTTSIRDTLDYSDEAYAIAGLDGSTYLDHEEDIRTNPNAYDRGSVMSRSSTMSGGSFASSGVLGHDRERMIRDSVSSYGALEEDAEPVIVTRATAIKLARAPSMSLQRSLDTIAYGQNNSSTRSPPPSQGVSRGVVGQASAQMVTMHGRGASSSSLLNPQTPRSAASQGPTYSAGPASSTVSPSADIGALYNFSMYQYDEEDEQEEESDEEEVEESSEEDEDADSRNTIRLDDVKADRLMAAVMQGGGVVDSDSTRLFQAPTRASPTTSRPAASVSTSLQSVEEPEERLRPLSTATIQTIRAESPKQLRPGQLNGQDHQHRPTTEYEDISPDDEDTSALDDWLEANEDIEDEQPRADSDQEDVSPLRTPSRGLESSDYDDADRPLKTGSTSYSTATDQSTQSQPSPHSADVRSPSTTYSPVQSPVTSEKSAISVSSEATSPGQKSVSSALPTGSSGFPLSPSALSSPPQSSSRASFRQSRRFSKYSGASLYSPLPGSASESEANSPASQYLQKRSSIIYAPTLPSIRLGTPLSTGSNLGGLSPLSKPSASPNTPYSPMSLVDEATGKLLEPVAEFVLPGDPRYVFGEMQLVAEGESGGIFAAKVLGDAGTPVTSASNLSRATTSSISSLVGSVVAIKRMRVCDETAPRIQTLRHELSILSSCGPHANVLTYGGMWLGNDPYVELWLQMELMERSLADVIALFQEGLSIEERHVARFAYDAACGLAFLEEAWIAHRDIRSDNLLVSAENGSVKIADFANAVQLFEGDTMRSDPAGIIYWQAPEMRKGPYDASKVDVWSLGASVWELVEGETPFEREEMSPTERLPELSNVQNVSQGLLGFLALCERPAKRRVRAKTLLETAFVNARCSQEEMMLLLGRARALEQANELE